MAYHIPLGFVPIVASHGNAKEKKPYFATWPSTMDKLKGKCLQQGPKSTIEHVSSSFGGVTGALAPGQLPRNEMQITKLKRRVKLCNDQHTSGSDELLVVMQRAHSQDPASKSIRSMRTTPDPAIVVSEQCQIKDMGVFVLVVQALEFLPLTLLFRLVILMSHQSHTDIFCLRQEGMVCFWALFSFTTGRPLTLTFILLFRWLEFLEN